METFGAPVRVRALCPARRARGSFPSLPDSRGVMGPAGEVGGGGFTATLWPLLINWPKFS